MILLHQVFGKHLAGLDLGSGGVGAKAGDPRGLDKVHHTGSQRVVGRHKHQIHRFFLRQGQHPLLVHGVHWEALSVPADAAVAGGTIDSLHLGAVFQFADNGVLTAAAADY